MIEAILGLLVAASAAIIALWTKLKDEKRRRTHAERRARTSENEVLRQKSLRETENRYRKIIGDVPQKVEDEVSKDQRDHFSDSR